jgi:hypothetical protein
MGIKLKIKQALCKHSYKPWANIFPPLSDSPNFDNCRTVFMCKKCNKRLYSKNFIEAAINFNLVVNWLHVATSDPNNSETLAKLEKNMILNKDKYKDFYDIED